MSKIDFKTRRGRESLILSASGGLISLRLQHYLEHDNQIENRF